MLSNLLNSLLSLEVNVRQVLLLINQGLIQINPDLLPQCNKSSQMLIQFITLQLIVFHMLKFRKLKDQIINSKRNSQLIEQQELFNLLQDQCSFSRFNISLNAKLQAEIHQIKDQDYKIYHQKYYKKDKQVLCEKSNRSKSKKIEHLTTEIYSQHKSNRLNYEQDFQQTAKKGNHLTRSLIEGSNFTKIIDLMKEVNDLQRRKVQFPKQCQSIKQQIRRKLAQVKFLICTIQDQSQKSLIDFYNEDCGQNYSPQSFHSQNSDETYQVQTQREAYQFSASKGHEYSNQNEQGQIQIKYRRISPNSCQDDSIYDTLDDQYQPVECLGFQQRSSQKSINHLFSYQKEKTLDSPLPSISQRESQYCSPSSKNSSHNQSLEFKKIYYLLQTSVKKQQTTGRRVVSQFTPNTKQQVKSIINSNEQRDRSRCHEQLQEMINLLQTRYKRKVTIGVQNIMDSLNIAIKQKNICLRTKK